MAGVFPGDAFTPVSARFPMAYASACGRRYMASLSEAVFDASAHVGRVYKYGGCRRDGQTHAPDGWSWPHEILLRLLKGKHIPHC